MVLLLQFDGVDDYVDLGNPSNLDFNLQPFSVGLWAYPLKNENTYAIAKFGGATATRSWGLQFRNDNQNVRIFKRTAGTGVDFAVYDFGSSYSNRWIYLVFTTDGTTLKLYVDGSEVTLANDDSGDIISGTADLVIGARSDPTLYFNGSIDEVKIYSRALTSVVNTKYIHLFE